MKLPFSIVLAPILKPYLGDMRMFCHNPVFAISVYYTCLYGILGFFISANHLRKHLGEAPPTFVHSPCDLNSDNFMLIHDLKIIATSMGIVQYICVLVGCVTENPALFLPHLIGQLIVIAVKILQEFLLITSANMKSIRRFFYNVPPILLLGFNWCQEFCVFRQFLCICDL